jgi:hypothetical protein
MSSLTRSVAHNASITVDMSIVAQLPFLNSQIERSLQAMLELHGMFSSLVHYRSKYAKKLFIAFAEKMGSLDEAIGEKPTLEGLAMRQIKEVVMEEAGFLERGSKQVETQVMGDILKLYEEYKNEKKEIDADFDMKKKFIENAKLQVAKKRKDCLLMYENLFNLSVKLSDLKMACSKEVNGQKREVLATSVASTEGTIKKNGSEAKKAFQDLERLVSDVNQRYRVFYGEELPAHSNALRRMDAARGEKLKEVLQKYSSLEIDSLKTLLDRRKRVDDAVKNVSKVDDLEFLGAEEMTIPEFPHLSPELPIESGGIEGQVQRILNGETNALAPLSPVSRSNVTSNNGGFFSSLASIFNSSLPKGATLKTPKTNSEEKVSPQSSSEFFLKTGSSEDFKYSFKPPSREFSDESPALSTSSVLKNSAESGPNVKKKPAVEMKKSAPQVPIKLIPREDRLESMGGPMILVDENVAEMMQLPPPPPPPPEDEQEQYSSHPISPQAPTTPLREDFGASMMDVVDILPRESSAAARSSFGVLRSAVALESSIEYQTEDGSVLEFQEGDQIVITDQTDQNWWGGYLKQDEPNNPEAKWFPAALVKLV